MKDILAGEEDGVINVHSRSRDPRARILSALTNRPFQIDGQMFASLEGFYQGINFSSRDPRRGRAFASSFGYAQQFGKQIRCKYVWWNQERIQYGSSRHKEIIELGFRASFDQNPDRIEALRATRGLTIVHETGEEDAPNSPLTSKEFCTILTRIRDEV